MRELTGTDVRQLAKGYWDSHFFWRTHPKAKAVMPVLYAALTMLVVLMIISSSVTSKSDVLAVFILLSFITLMGAIAWVRGHALLGDGRRDTEPRYSR